jgi:hypothetical protein
LALCSLFFIRRTPRPAGAKGRACEGYTIWQWGDITPYWDRYIDGGDPYCGCGDEEYHTYEHGTCPA